MSQVNQTYETLKLSEKINDYLAESKHALDLAVKVAEKSGLSFVFNYKNIIGGTYVPKPKTLSYHQALNLLHSKKDLLLEEKDLVLDAIKNNGSRIKDTNKHGWQITKEKNE